MDYYIGLDNGGTLTKAALYTDKGKEITVCSTETKALIPKHGFTERDMDEMWKANCQVLKKVLDETSVNPADIKGIACCGHGKGLYLWGNNNKPVRNGIISTDNRAWEYPVKWEQEGIAAKVFEKTYQRILACQPVSLLAWLRDNEPECLKQIKWIFECKDYIRFRLTGEAYAEITDYSGANLVNLETRTYDSELLELFGLTSILEKLPPLRKSTDICGQITKEVALLTGLKEGTPVAGGMFDIDACAIAVDAATKDRICIIAGTWSINEYIRTTPVTNGIVMMNSLFCLPEYYLIEECSPTSAGNNEWFINTLMPELKAETIKKGESIYDVVNDLAGSISPEEACPFFLPFLMGSNVHPTAKACFLGLTSYHTREHIIRSVYEGIVFSHKYHFDKLLATRDEPVTEIRLAGGVTKSALWSQIFADVLGYPVVTVDINEAGTLGCAMTAAVATGAYDSFSEAAANMIIVKNRFMPHFENTAIYTKKYSLYKKITESLVPIWDEIHKLYE